MGTEECMDTCFPCGTALPVWREPPLLNRRGPTHYLFQPPPQLFQQKLVPEALTPFMVTAVCTLEATASTRDAMRSQPTPSFFFRMAFSA